MLNVKVKRGSLNSVFSLVFIFITTAMNQNNVAQYIRHSFKYSTRVEIPMLFEICTNNTQIEARWYDLSILLFDIDTASKKVLYFERSNELKCQMSNGPDVQMNRKVVPFLSFFFLVQIGSLLLYWKYRLLNKRITSELSTSSIISPFENSDFDFSNNSVYRIFGLWIIFSNLTMNQSILMCQVLRQITLFSLSN